MQDDFSNIQFNRNHKRDSAAREAAIGLRWLIAAIFFNVIAIGASLMVAATADTMIDSVAAFAGLAILVCAVAAFACGAYGVYSMLDSLGWAGWASAVVIASLLLPYVKLLVLIVVAVKAINLIEVSGYRFSLFGALKRKSPPPLPSA